MKNPTPEQEKPKPKPIEYFSTLMGESPTQSKETPFLSIATQNKAGKQNPK